MLFRRNGNMTGWVLASPALGGRLPSPMAMVAVRGGRQEVARLQIALSDIYAARRRIAGCVRHTLLVESRELSKRTGVAIKLKLEHHQVTGSFKLRGATNALLRLTESAAAHGIVAASTGNHGRALAYAASLLRMRCAIVMSRHVPDNKVEAIRRLGADVRIGGQSQDDAQREVDRLVTDEGLTPVPPFDHPDVIAGQGTIGLELMEEFPDLAAVLVPLSGGGLISGIALAVKAINPAAEVIGISMGHGAAMHASQQAGHPVEVAELPTLADSLGGGIGLDNRWTFRMVRDLVDRIVLLDEPEIAAAIHYAYWHEQEIVEGGGAVGIGALLSGKLALRGPTAIVVSGRNIDMRLHHQLISRGDSVAAT
jgi:threonine dehydratase